MVVYRGGGRMYVVFLTKFYTTRHDEFNILCRIVFGSAQLFEEFKWSVVEVSVFRVRYFGCMLQNNILYRNCHVPH